MRWLPVLALAWSFGCADENDETPSIDDGPSCGHLEIERQTFGVDAAGDVWLAWRATGVGCGPNGDGRDAARAARVAADFSFALLEPSIGTPRFEVEVAGAWAAVSTWDFVLFAAGAAEAVPREERLEGEMVSAIALWHDGTSYAVGRSSAATWIQRDTIDGEASRFEPDPDSGFTLLTATSDGVIVTNRDRSVVRKLAPDGDEVWQLPLGATNEATAIAADESGRVYVGSIERGFGGRSTVRRIGADGAVDPGFAWTADTWEVASLTASNDAGLVCVGSTNIAGGIRCFDESGAPAWRVDQTATQVQLGPQGVWYGVANQIGKLTLSGAPSWTKAIEGLGNWAVEW